MSREELEKLANDYQIKTKKLSIEEIAYAILDKEAVIAASKAIEEGPKARRGRPKKTSEKPASNTKSETAEAEPVKQAEPAAEEEKAPAKAKKQEKKPSQPKKKAKEPKADTPAEEPAAKPQEEKTEEAKPEHPENKKRGKRREAIRRQSCTYWGSSATNPVMQCKLW